MTAPAQVRGLLGGPDDHGDIPEWKHLAVSDLPASGLEGAPAVVSGAQVIIVGGKTAPNTILRLEHPRRTPHRSARSSSSASSARPFPA